MIILDDDEPQNPDKLSDDARSVNRPSTPTPSLPSYEFSQALQVPQEDSSEQHTTTVVCWPKQTKARVRRALLYALVIYFFITVAVGVPVIIVKLKHRSFERQNMYSPGPTASDSASLIAAGSEGSLLVSAAVGCNEWLEESMTESTLQYVVPLNDLVFLHSNVSYQSDSATLQDVSGNLSVGVNSDPTVTDAIISVSMQYSDLSLKERTSVCLMNISNSNGVYLYVPSNLSVNDSLSFDMTFLFPQVPSLHVSEFVTMLPQFTQWFTSLSSYVTFDKVSLGGPRSKVSVGSIEATSMAVKTALAEIEGNFNVSESLVLETVSAPINVNITLYNSGAQRTFLDVSTGNAALHASVSLYLPPSTVKTVNMPDFLTRFETFNAPLALLIKHLPNSAASVLDALVDNTLGEALVSVDNKYTGTFDVWTTFENADVLTSSVDSVDALTQFDMNLYRSMSSTTASGTTAERSVEFDVIQTSRISGWVGTGARPSDPVSPPRRHHEVQGNIRVMSTLSPVALLLGP